MAQRYVRVKTNQGQIHYGLLELGRRVQVFDAPPWLGGKPTEQALAVGEYQLLAPCAPSKIVAIGKNYQAHAAEMESAVPDEPLMFLKPPTAVIASGDYIEYPEQSHRLDYEGELAVVVGDRLKDVTPEQARSKIWGYTVANDVTARDLQQKDGQWTRGKGFDTFCPLGPWIVRELSAGAKIQTFVGDRQGAKEEQELRQSALLSDMVFSPEEILSYVSQVMTLLPGDVVLTGTPEGIGPLQIGQRVRVAIEGIGNLENEVCAPGGKVVVTEDH